MALITGAEARELIPSLKTGSQDALLDALIRSADALMAQWCLFPPASVGGARTLEATTYTWYLKGPDALDPRALKLPMRPIQSITSIHDDVEWSYAASSEVTSSEWVLDGSRGKVHLNPDSSHAWSLSNRAIKVVAVAGYSTVPEAVKTAARMVVKALFEGGRHTVGRTEVSQRDTTEKLDPEAFIPPAARVLLRGTRLVEHLIA